MITAREWTEEDLEMLQAMMEGWHREVALGPQDEDEDELDDEDGTEDVK